MAKKQKEKPLVSDHELASPDTLLGKIKTYNDWQGTDDQTEKLKEMDQLFDATERQYLVKKRGEKKGSPGKPKTYKIKTQLEAQELVNRLALNAIAADYGAGGEHAVRAHIAEPGQIRAYLERKGIAYDKLVKKLIGSNLTDRQNMKEWQDFKNFAIQYSIDTVVEGVKASDVIGSIEYGSDKHDQILEIGNDHLSGTGYKLSPKTKPGEVIGHLTHLWREGGFSDKYAEKNSNTLVPSNVIHVDFKPKQQKYKKASGQN
jgi:hypothetical protein